ncbi:MerR family transcriptional regulator [Streptomyces sp. NPDC054865]
MLSRRAGTATPRRVSGSVHDSSAVQTWGTPGRGLSRMQIGELSKRTGPNPRSLRYYENQGPLSSSHSGAGQRPLPPSPPSRPVPPRARPSSRWHEKCRAAQRRRPSVADRRRQVVGGQGRRPVACADPAAWRGGETGHLHEREGSAVATPGGAGDVVRQREFWPSAPSPRPGLSWPRWQPS